MSKLETILKQKILKNIAVLFVFLLQTYQLVTIVIVPSLNYGNALSSDDIFSLQYFIGVLIYLILVLINLLVFTKFKNYIRFSTFIILLSVFHCTVLFNSNNNILLSAVSIFTGLAYLFYTGYTAVCLYKYVRAKE